MATDKHIFINGVFWNAIQKYSGLVISLFVTMVLARLLTPNEFGTIAIAIVIINFLTLLSDMGISPAIVQRQDLSQDDLDSIFSFSIYVGFLLSIVFYLLAGLISEIYETPNLKYVCQLLAISVLFSSANMVPNALMTKNFRFKEIAKRTLLLQIITGVLSILSAYMGLGVYSLLISPILTSIGIFIYNRKFYKLKFIFAFSFNPLKKIFAYSAFQFLFKFINYFAANIDKLIIGKAITTSLLGQYQKAYQLVQLPLSNVDAVVSPILHPLLAKYQNDKIELITRYNKIILLLATIGIPMGVTMYFCGEEVIEWFYGSQWTLAIPSFKILSIGAPIYMIISCCGSFFQAANETKSLFNLGLINSSIMISVISIASIFFRTIEAVAIGWTLSILSNFIWTYYFIYKKILGQSILEGVKLLFKPALFGLVLTILLHIINILFNDMIVICFIIKVITAILTILLLMYKTKQIRYIKSYIFKK